MRKSIFRLAAAAALITLALSGNGPTLAEAKEGPLYAHSKTAKITRKFLRGFGNVFFGWAEIPRSVFQKAYSTDPLTGFVYGMGEGGKKAAERMGVGLWETVSFFSPVQRDYRPYIEPEFVLMDEQD